VAEAGVPPDLQPFGSMANQVPPTPWPLASPGWVFWRSGRPATTDGDLAAAIGAGHLAGHPRVDALDVDRALGEIEPWERTGGQALAQSRRQLDFGGFAVSFPKR
jgi:hypothetical protein